MKRAFQINGFGALRALWIFHGGPCNYQQYTNTSGDHVQPLPRCTPRQEMRHNRRTDDGADGEEAFNVIHGRSMLNCRLGDITDQRERAGLKNADCHAGNHKEDYKERKRSTY